jgi:hypothetical protein
MKDCGDDDAYAETYREEDAVRGKKDQDDRDHSDGDDET